MGLAVWNRYLPLLVYPMLADEGIPENEEENEDVGTVDTPGDTPALPLDRFVL
jgi:hypothetical protein